MNPTMTLAAIRAAGPCREGWQKLIAGLGYASGNFDPELQVSLGDVATTNDAADALWCLRALDWSDVAVRRAVVAGAVLPPVKRASAHTKDQRVHDCISAVERWCAGDDTVDLKAARAAARAAQAAAAEAAWAAAARAAARAAAEAAAQAAERDKQRADIIAAFPCVALAPGSHA